MVAAKKSGRGLLGRAERPLPEISDPWPDADERRVASECQLCPGGCGVPARVVDERLVKVEGNPLNPVNQGRLCPPASMPVLSKYSQWPGNLKRSRAAGMAVLSFAIVLPLQWAARGVTWAYNGLTAIVGIVTIIFGAPTVYEVGVSGGWLM